jgi:hypothetical protein
MMKYDYVQNSVRPPRRLAPLPEHVQLSVPLQLDSVELPKAKAPKLHMKKASRKVRLSTEIAAKACVTQLPVTVFSRRMGRVSANVSK